MQCSAWRPTSSASTSVRPLSSSTRWNSRGPSPSRTPVQSDVYGFIRSPVEERGSSCSITSRSRHSRQHLLDPHHRDEHLRQRDAEAAVALGLHDADRPGLRDREVRAGHRDRAPTGTSRAGAAAPPRPAPAGRAGRSCPSAIVRVEQRRGSPPGCGGSPARGCATGGRRRAARSAPPGRSRPPRCPRSASASLRPISSVASDLTLTTSSIPCPCAIRATIALASAASRAQCTVPPAAVTAASRRSSCSGSVAIARALIAAPASRSASQSGTSSTTAARLARIVEVALPRLRRSWGLASATLARCGKPAGALMPCSPGPPPGASPGRRHAGGSAPRRCA